MSKPAPIFLEVASSRRLTPNMQRLILRGEALNDFPTGQNGAHIKLMFPTDGAKGYSDDGAKPKVRTYTVRDFDTKSQQLTVDFALHEPAGPATQWALQAVEGDPILMRGPGPKKIDPEKGDWFLFMADMAALPAALAAIEELNAAARGVAFFEIDHPEDVQQIAFPKNLHVQWHVRQKGEERGQWQLEQLQALEFPGGEANVFAAGELNVVRSLKAHLCDKRELKAEDMYISSYWKQGLHSDDHKIAKKIL